MEQNFQTLLCLDDRDLNREVFPHLKVPIMEEISHRYLCFSRKKTCQERMKLVSNHKMKECWKLPGNISISDDIIVFVKTNSDYYSNHMNPKETAKIVDSY